MTPAYYNEWDPYAAEWLRNLIRAGHIAPGDVDERSITDVKSTDLVGYRQCHFFAGIGGWSLALRLAGWKDEQKIWTASCPCQPFSVAAVAHGGARGQSDERHLLPKLLSLIEEFGPPVVLGEQVANAIKWGWLDEAFRGLENLGYACASAVFPAFAVGARHERDRLYWVADTGSQGREGHQQIQRLPISTAQTLSVIGDPFVRAGRAMGGDYIGLLPIDGVSVAVERCATKGYGNAIVPPAAAEFVAAYMECRP